MKKLISLTAAVATVAIFTGCALISPYNIIFTTPNESVINPATDTLDLAINIDALAYISGVKCDGYDSMELLPIVRDDMEVSKAHNLSLGMLDSFEPGTKCEITVTAFDKTTTASAYERITLHVLEKIEIEEDVEAVESEDTEDAEVTEEAAYCEDGTVCEEEAAEDAATEEVENTDTNETNETEATETGDDSSTEE